MPTVGPGLEMDQGRTAFEPDPFRQATPAELDSGKHIMIHVLIVVSWLGGAVQGATISTQEFSSAERCEAARLALIEYAKARSIEETLRPVCTQK
jgi:hypothetical protein